MCQSVSTGHSDLIHQEQTFHLGIDVIVLYLSNNLDFAVIIQGNGDKLMIPFKYI